MRKHTSSWRGDARVMMMKNKQDIEKDLERAVERGAKVVFYQKREFCKAVGCPIQELLDDYPKIPTPQIRAIQKTVCQNGCLHTAWEFHDWLQRQGFKIVKEA